MTKNEAHDLLDRRKQGFAVPLYIVNRALLVSGDISMACSPCQAARVESTSMAQGEGTGVMPDSLMAWNKNRFDEPYESPI
jgi:hypothetical protein